MSRAATPRTPLHVQPHVRQLERVLRVFLGCAPDVPLTIEQARLRTAALPDVVISWTSARGTAAGLAKEGHSHAYRFVVLPSQSKPRWILPYAPGKGIDGWELYVPYSRKARFAKALFARIGAIRWPGWARDPVLVTSQKPLAIMTLVCEATAEKEVLCALSVGTPGTFQKLTVQVMRPDGSILGYLKMPLTDRAEQRLRHEAEIVEQLHQFPSLRPHIPALLFAGLWRGRFVVFQSRVPGEMGPVRFTTIQERFLGVLQGCRPSIASAEGLLQQTGRQWEAARGLLGARWHGLGSQTMKIALRELRGSRVACGLHHGDFAPWNTRVDRGNLSVFDWESAECAAPTLWDQFHFLSQAECVLKERVGQQNTPDIRTANRALYLLYLLNSTAQAAQEGARQFAIDYREKQIVRQLASLGSASA